MSASSNPLVVTRSNLPVAVETALSACREMLGKRGSSTIAKNIARDLEVAVSTLESIQNYLQLNSPPPKQQRPATFTWYVVDRGEAVSLDKDLVRLITSIEDVYRRRW
jgi:hypothetical protein